MPPIENAPFGGIKQSGTGGEGGPAGIKEMCHAQQTALTDFGGTSSIMEMAEAVTRACDGCAVLFSVFATSTIVRFGILRDNGN